MSFSFQKEGLVGSFPRSVFLLFSRQAAARREGNLLGGDSAPGVPGSDLRRGAANSLRKQK